MKVKRADWEAMNAKLARLEAEVRDARRDTLVSVKTGQVLASVAVQAILRHLRMDVVHGYADLQPAKPFPRLQANGAPWDERPGAVNLVNV